MIIRLLVGKATLDHRALMISVIDSTLGGSATILSSRTASPRVTVKLRSTYVRGREKLGR
jgi:hypothetical protein